MCSESGTEKKSGQAQSNIRNCPNDLRTPLSALMKCHWPRLAEAASAICP
jgi:hypothetical protein